MARCKYCHRPLRSPSSVMRGVGDNCARAHDDGCVYLDPAYFNRKQLSLLDIGPTLQLPNTFGNRFSGDLQHFLKYEILHRLLYPDLPECHPRPMRIV